MGERHIRRPSPRWGWTRALSLWRLVLACWVVSWLAFAPALLVIRTTVFRALAALPEGPAALPAGDIQLIIFEAGRHVVRPLGLAVISGLVVLWAWTVLWHAGVVAWQLWTGGRRVRLGEVLGLGMVAWWRYVRLSATALAVWCLLAAAIWIPLWNGVRSAFHSMAEERMMVLLAGGFVAVDLIGFGVWLTTLHAAWLLGLPEHRSAVLTWLRGIWGVLRTPFSTVGTWLVWVIPALLAALIPLIVGIGFAELRGTPVLIALGLIASLVRAFCWVGLFNSFAPVTGVVGHSDEGETEDVKRQTLDVRRKT